MGPIPGVIGTLQAMEALKVAMRKGIDDTLTGRMLIYDGASTRSDSHDHATNGEFVWFGAKMQDDRLCAYDSSNSFL